MILPTGFGLTRTRRLPAFRILDRSYPPARLVKTMLDTRGWKIVRSRGGLTTLSIDGALLTMHTPRATTVIWEWFEVWEKHYLPPSDLKGKTVLDVGAGCGETACFFFRHGAKKVICVEIDPDQNKLAQFNSAINGWNAEVVGRGFELEDLRSDVDYMKMDCEGCEAALLLGREMPAFPHVIELHGQELLEGFMRTGRFRVAAQGRNPIIRADGLEAKPRLDVPLVLAEGA